MYRLLLLLCTCALAAAYHMKSTDKPFYSLEESEKHFEAFIEKFNRNYLSETEKKSRFEIFKRNLAIINQKNLNPQETASFDITKFSDLTDEEFIRKYTGLDMSFYKPSGNKVNVSGPVTMDLPDSFSWVDKAVTRVKDQGGCGSCWAFSATGVVEGASAIKYKKLVEFSEQQLLDCDFENDACYGGWPSEALSYIQKTGGIETEEDYPYLGNRSSCKFETQKAGAVITKVVPLSLQNEEALQEVLVSTGPISLVLDGTTVEFYNGGIMNSCPFSDYNHAVLLVGYGKENGTPFWTIKNSWGADWGEKGYFRVKMGINACGLLNEHAVSAEVK